nr:MAG: hypothetical protein [Bacteriophage sp.]
MQDNLDINAIIERNVRKWQLVELCSPVKVWVAHQRRKRLKGQWMVTRTAYGDSAPREHYRQRRLLEILQREGARIEHDQQVTAIREAYPGVSHLSAKHLLKMWGKR